MGHRPATSMSFTQHSSINSLSNLSLALEKLNAPAPSRPNTSLGFNRDAGGGSDDATEETKSDGAMDVDSEPKSKTAPKSASGQAAGSNASRYRRATTVGPSTISASSSVSKSGAPSTIPRTTSSVLMPPPPLPKTQAAGGAADTGRKPINVNSGMVGSSKGFLFGGKTGNRTASQKLFGVAPLPGFASRGGRVVHRASKRTSLPMVEGSPVKGGEADEDVPMEDAVRDNEDDDTVVVGTSATPDTNPFAAGPSSTPDVPMEERTPVAGDGGETTRDTERQERANMWKNESRRASMALHQLAQDLSACPETPPRRAPATEGKGKGRAASSFPQDPKTAPGGLGKAGGVGAHVSRSTRTTRASAAAATATANNSPAATSSSQSTPQQPEPVHQSVRVLKNCVIYVDVKSSDGLDAGGLFVDMLKGMGAKVGPLVRRSGVVLTPSVGLDSCRTDMHAHCLQEWHGQYVETVSVSAGHSGELEHTTHTFYCRALDDPKPLAVDIRWVVECAEQKAHVDEKPFLISLENENVAGTKVCSALRKQCVMLNHFI